MKPVKQTKFGMEGNCFAACLASILEMNLEDLPDLMPHDKITNVEQEKILNKWLEPFGLFYKEIRCHESMLSEYFPGIYHTIIGSSPRLDHNKDLSHVVVGLEGKMVHDPHPDNKAPLGLLSYGIFIAKDAGDFMRKVFNATKLKEGICGDCYNSKCPLMQTRDFNINVTKCDRFKCA